MTKCNSPSRKIITCGYVLSNYLKKMGIYEENSFITVTYNNNGSVDAYRRVLDRFRKAGEEYEATLTLSAETIAELERPMISAEDYIRNVNRN